MKIAASWVILLVSLCGCKHPITVLTHSHVYPNNPPVKDGSAVVEMPVAASRSNGYKIALIDVDGLLLNMNMTGLSSYGENPIDVFREKLDRVAADPCYCGVVLRINSPGGSVTATDIMWNDLQRFKARTGLPVVAILMDVATGGAYYLATAADHLMAHPTTITGGIGVILNLYNLEDTMLQYNIGAITIKSGQLTDMGTPVRALTDRSRQLLDDTAGAFHQRFRNVVRQSRSLDLPDDAPVFDGRILTAPLSLDHSLIDSIGYIDDALRLGAEMGGCPGAKTVVLHRHKDRARTPYAITPNSPLQNDIFPINLPGLDRSKLPTFLYLWQPDPSLVP